MTTCRLVQCIYERSQEFERETPVKVSGSVGSNSHRQSGLTLLQDTYENERSDT